MTSLRRSHEHTVMPWANGKGVSYEVAREVDGLGEWVWRLAIAPIVEDGPFSVLNEVHRELTLLEGDGLVLTIDGNMVTCRQGEVVEFSGESHTHAALTGGPVVDLNVMSRAGHERVMSIVEAPAIIAGFDCLVALGEVRLEFAAHTEVLARRDALVGGGSVELRSGSVVVVRPRS